ncbi:MAG: hypothetical protein ACK5WZ_08415 [Pseudobdellovibrionaceae bacterium]
MKSLLLSALFAVSVMLTQTQAQAQVYGDIQDLQQGFGFNQGNLNNGQWVLCAYENEICHVPGKAQVRYGAQGQYAYLQVKNSVSCSNYVFGDPIYGVKKQCWYLRKGNGGGGYYPPQPPPQQQRWIYCASEGEYCQINSNYSVQVRYGANGHYSYRQTQGPIPCDNNVFGDPIYGVRKICEYLGY